MDKHFILSLIQWLGHDALVQPGRFLFTTIPDVLEVFVYLHNIIEQIGKERLETCADKDILKTCLNFLSEIQTYVTLGARDSSALVMRDNWGNAWIIEGWR